MKKFRLVISSPEGNIFDDDIENISLRGSQGSLAIMAGHIPFMTDVVPCEVSIDNGDDIITGKTDTGLLTVTSEKVTLLSGSFEFNEET